LNIHVSIFLYIHAYLISSITKICTQFSKASLIRA
jgi:hypothetical protein